MLVVATLSSASEAASNVRLKAGEPTEKVASSSLFEAATGFTDVHAQPIPNADTLLALACPVAQRLNNATSAFDAE